MEECVSETISETTGDIIAGNPFLGKNCERPIMDCDTGKFVHGDTDEISSQVCLDQRVWSKLPEELLIHIFARLPIDDISLRIRFLNKSWRSTITSPQFQQAFVDASVVRVARMVSDEVDGTMFLTQENKEECFRWPIFYRSLPEMPEETYIVATADGLVCIIEDEQQDEPGLLADGDITRIKVFVMNIVTGVRRELPPHIMTILPELVRMETNVAKGGYTITFIYTYEYSRELEVSSWQVYDSATNSWRKDGVEALAHLRDVEVFNMEDTGLFYGNLATFHKETKEIRVLNLHASSANYDSRTYIPDPNGHVHNVSGELYKFCMREEQYGVWKLTSSGRWEMVCAVPHIEDVCIEDVRTCLRVMNDWVVLVFKFPDQYQDKDGVHDGPGTFVKVFHVPSKSWHAFPEKNLFISNWGMNNEEPRNLAFIVEVKFDAIP